MKKSPLLLLLLFAVIMLPLTVFSLLQEQDTRSNASTNLTTNTGRPFADNSAWNQPIGSNVQIDPNSAAIVSKLASGKQGASLYDFGTPIFFANASTPKYPINCLMNWGTCGLEAEPVPIPADARQAPGSDAQMVIIDLSGRKSYEFWVYKNDKASANWGAILPLDGDGRGTPDNSAIGAGTSRLAGIIRTYEIEQGVIDHALVFSTKFCQGPIDSSNFRYPATKTDGKYTGDGAIPEGARVQLDPSIDVNSIPGISKGEKAVAVALQKYGAYAIDCGGAEMAIQFENPIGKNDPYPAAGLTNDYFEFDKIPWNKLRVLKEWNSYTAVGGIQPTNSSPAPTNITPTYQCLAGTPCTSPLPTATLAPGVTGGAGQITLPPVGGTNPTINPTNPSPTVSPCAIDAISGIATDKHKKKIKHKHNNGGGFIEQLIKFLLRLIGWLISGGQLPPPNQNPTPSTAPTGGPQPTQAPGPDTQPCPEPTTKPSTVPQPTIVPTIGLVSPTLGTQPTTIPTKNPTTSNAQLPAQIVNLSNWKLQLPIGQEEKPTEIKQPALATYKNDKYFTVLNGGIRFRAPVNGVTTSGSLYPRSELREMTNNGATQASWSTTTGTHTMFLDQSITAVPATKKHVVAGQIHDGDSDVIVARLEYPKLYINIGGEIGPTLDANYTLGKRFTVKFEAKGGKINIYYNGSTTPVHTITKNISTAYFKAGAYTQSNCTREATTLCKATNYGEVIIYKAEVTHQ